MKIIISFCLWCVVGIVLLIVGSKYKKKSGICEECGNVLKNRNVCQNCGNPITNKNKTISSLCIIFGWLILIGNIIYCFVFPKFFL